MSAADCATAGRRRRCRSAGLWALALLALLVARPAAAAAPALTPADLATFFEATVVPTMRERDLAGAAVAVVHDGRVLFLRGYGLDGAGGRPLDPVTTRLALGSISKLVTWTAVMQLAERRRLDLDADVQRYIDFELPRSFDHPITLRHLMTHTAGFEDVAKDDFKFAPAGLRGIGAYLKANVPAQIYPPGAVVAYSNYGATLAGYVVERVSGRPFADHVAAEIFAPLGMRTAGFAAHVTGPAGPGGEFIEQLPAGAARASAADVARFMIAHLTDGRLGASAILQPVSARRMREPQAFPPTPGRRFALGFYQEDRNGRRIVGHAGDTLDHHGDLHLLPDEGVGLFVMFTSPGSHGGASLARKLLFRAFLDRYFPDSSPLTAEVHDRAEAALVAGTYLSSRRTVSALRPLQLLRQSTVTADAAGRLTVSNLRGADGEPKRWLRTGPLTYREAEGRSRLWFIAGKDGRISAWTTDDAAPTALQLRVAPLGRRDVVLAAGLAGQLLLAGALLLALTGRRSDAPARWLRRVAIAACALQSVALIGWWRLAVAVRADPLLLSARLEPWLLALYGVSALASLGAIATVAQPPLRWRHVSPRERTADALAAAAALVFLALVLRLGLASFSMRF